MRRKIIQDLANTLCQMLVGWRMAEDLEVLAELPDGVLSIDVLAGTASHSVGGAVQTSIAGELQAWLLHRLSVTDIPIAAICSAQITAHICTDRIATNRKKIISFDFAVESVIATDQRSYAGRLREIHHWHSRVPSNNSFKPRPLRGSA